MVGIGQLVLLSPSFGGRLRRLRQIRVGPLHMLLERLSQPRCITGALVEALTHVFECVMDALSAVFAHHPWSNLPLAEEACHMAFEIVQLGEYGLLWQKFAIRCHECHDISFCRGQIQKGNVDLLFLSSTTVYNHRRFHSTVHQCNANCCIIVRFTPQSQFAQLVKLH